MASIETGRQPAGRRPVDLRAKRQPSSERPAAVNCRIGTSDHRIYRRGEYEDVKKTASTQQADQNYLNSSPSPSTVLSDTEAGPRKRFVTRREQNVVGKQNGEPPERKDDKEKSKNSGERMRDKEPTLIEEEDDECKDTHSQSKFLH
ncbi:unnamed protein product [Protopolystoma xenopodis]|uniref:Uncharacterized protein n=1 Tax=Protopolystoma xenopodis TaxID=117903 RepID=A0A448WGT9_9PLAT|nr:unnamed protein product [Protopolystoma xenopodis]